MSIDVVEFRPTRRVLILTAAIALIGLTPLPWLTSLSFVPIVQRNLDTRPGVALTISVSGLMANCIRFAMALFIVVWVSIWVGVSIWGLHCSFARCIFSRRTGRFSRAPFSSFGGFEPGADVSLNSISAIQLLSRVVPGDGSESGPYHVHELNLVLKDGSRVNIGCHGGEGGMRKDSTLLSEFLEVPVWEISEH